MRSVKIQIPYFGSKTSPVKIFEGEKILTLKNSFGDGNYTLILVKENRHHKHVSVVGSKLANLEINLEGFEWFWLERANFLGRGGEIIGVIREKS